MADKTKNLSEDVQLDLVHSAMLRYGTTQDGASLGAKELGLTSKEYSKLASKVVKMRRTSARSSRAVDNTVADNVMSLIMEGYNSRTFWAKDMLSQLYALDGFVLSACCAAKTNVQTIPDNQGKVVQVTTCQSCGKPCNTVRMTPKDRYKYILECLEFLKSSDVDLAKMAAQLKYINPDAGEDDLESMNRNNYLNITVSNGENKKTTTKTTESIDIKSGALSEDSPLNSLKGYEAEAVIKSLEREILEYASGESLKIDSAEQSVAIHQQSEESLAKVEGELVSEEVGNNQSESEDMIEALRKRSDEIKKGKK